MSIKKSIPSILIPMLILCSLPTASAFSDNGEGDKHFVAINYLEEKGIIKGFSDGTFRPQQNITRAEAIKMLMLASGAFTEEEVKNIETEERPFNDVSLLAWYTPYLALAKEKGIVQGLPDNTFLPNHDINLVETLKIYLESYDNLIYPTEFRNHWLDVDENGWYAKYLRYADSRDLLETFPSNKIYPFAAQNRGDLAGIIYRKKKSAEGQFEFGKATFYGKAVQGNYTASGKIFDYHQLTAAHKHLPFGTIVRVSNMANGKSVDVEITDRGPYGPGRIIDLTEAAFEEIAWLGTGVIHCQMEVISSPL